MDSLTAALDALGGALAEVAGDALRSDALREADDAQLVSILAAVGTIGRHVEALLIEAAARVEQRSCAPALSERMTTRLGCRSTSELIQRTTRMSARSARELSRAAAAVGRDLAPSSGELLPAEYPALREAVVAGCVGVDGVLAIAGPLSEAVLVAGPSARLAADEELAACARGAGADGAPPACADDLRSLAVVWSMYLDQDGAEPREQRAMRKRGVSLGVCRDGLVPLRGNLLAETAAQLQRIFDSILNPRVAASEAASGPRFAETADAPGGAGDGAGDDSEAVRAELADTRTRTRTQRQHDAFATALAKAAASGELPTLGGAAPTLVVAVRASDLESGRGFAHLEGSAEPVSLAVARHVACCGDVQRVVFDAHGGIVSLGTSDRIFPAAQRRAIALRDGGCVIPGCRVPASWCEIHHVEDHARGGPTHTRNGVPLCWWHHRTIETSGWRIRMNGGVPQVRGPSWWDAPMTWRAVTTSPVRLLERRERAGAK